YFSSSGATSGKALSDAKREGKLMKAGRMDIAIHSLIQGIFHSHNFREDTKFHLFLYGMPDPPKHVEIQPNEDLTLSKKDVGDLLKKVLYKFKEGQKTEVLPGCTVEKKSIVKEVEEMAENGQKIFLLDKKGEDLREVEIPPNSVFIFGDHEGLPKKEAKRLKKSATPLSVGPKMYFASQTVAIVHNELDRRGF
ncbi:MAG: tRNA (pseudouridine(54)-N(1))-methyltransferase TrmY, partial [Candidatus Paceibacteria bacterium]